MKNGKMVRSCALGAAVALCLALGASAASVSAYEAARVACAWMVREGRAAATDLATSSLVTTNDSTYYAVKMKGGGTVITTGDTAFEPVVIYSGATIDFSSLDRRNPLWDILNGDAAARRQAVAGVPANAPMATRALASNASLAAALANETTQANERKWAALLAEGETASEASSFTLSRALGSEEWIYPGYTVRTGLADVRVGPLCQTRWSQDVAQNKATYNYYTPNGDDPGAFTPGDAGNIVCGCVATAMSQVMRYFEWPKASVKPVTRECSWYKTSMNLTMQGGVYDWDKMPLVPETGTLTDEQRMAIGKLTSDAGISVYMGYNTPNDDGTPSGESGAYSFDVGKSMREVFGYASATYFYDNSNMIYGKYIEDFDAVRSEALQRTIYANLDAGLPMVMGLTGHEVVADGYGYSSDGLDYVHINMGWAGHCDYWYCMPVVKYNSSTYGGLMYFSDLTYNIFTNATGSAVVSGRVFDGETNAVADATVRLYAKSGHALKAEVKTNAKGVYGAVVPAGTYSLKVEVNGLLGELGEVTVSCPATTKVTWNGMRTVDTVFTSDPKDLGNSWGNEIVLRLPNVRVGEHLYSTLDSALEEVGEGDVVEVLAPVELAKSVSVAVDCTIVATNDDPLASAVTRTDGAAIEVVSGASVTVRNFVFVEDDVSGVPGIVAGEGAKVRFSGKLGVGTVSVADDEGFVLAGGLSNVSSPITVQTGFAVGRGLAFGTYDCDYATAAASAFNIFCAADLDLGGEAESGTGRLVWERVPISPEIALSYVEIGGEKVYYRSIDRVFADASGDMEIVMLRDGSANQFTGAVSVAHNVILRTEDGADAVTLVPSGSARFDVVSGGSLVVKDLTLNGANNRREGALVAVQGGSLTLESGATLANLVGGPRLGATGGAIVLTDGTVTMKSGASISNCSSEGGRGGQGGAIWVGGANCTLDLLGGSITGCTAVKAGGGVYVYSASGYEPTVRVANDLVVSGNTSDLGADDLYVVNADYAKPEISARLTGSVGLRYGTTSSGNAAGDACATFGAAVSDTYARKLSAGHLFSDVDDGFSAEVDATQSPAAAVWTEDSTTGEVDSIDDAQAIVTYTNGTQRYYISVENAFACLEGDATICVTGGLFKTDIVVSHDVTLASTLETDGTLDRAAECSITVAPGGRLTVTNLQIFGYNHTTNDQYGVGSLIKSTGGEIVLGNGATVGPLAGSEGIAYPSSRAAACVEVWKGSLTMRPGSKVCGGYNAYVAPYKAADSAVGGGILLEAATARFEGGIVTNCVATRGGGIYAGSGSEVYVSGDFTVKGNFLPDGTTESNFVLERSSSLHLDGALSGEVGFREGVYWTAGSVFGDVTWEWTDYSALSASAAKFIHDESHEAGSVATNDEGKAILVWNDGHLIYTGAGGAIYNLVAASGATVVTPKSSAPALASLASAAAESESDPDMMRLVFEDTTAGCWYKLYTTQELGTDWTLAGEKLSTGGELVFEAAKDGEARYWKVVAEPGVK